MKTHQLNALVTIADTGSIRAAARTLGLSPAALTRTIRDIEADLQVPLVNRSAAGISFTEYGRSLIVHARLVISQIAQAEAEINAMRCAPAGKLTVGITPWVALSFLPETTRRFLERMPDVQLEFFEALPGVVQPKLRDGTIDFVIGRLGPAAMQSEFRHVPLFVTHSTVVARRGHPNAQVRSLAELADATWLLPWDTNSRDSHAQVLFKRYGLPEPKRIHFVHSLVIALAQLTNSDMLSIFPWPLVESDMVRERVCALSIGEDLEETSVGFISRRAQPMSSVAECFMHCLREVVSEGVHSSDPNRRRLFHSVEVVP
ncbi:LysR family transcriptional regulator [Burkholderia diffusa]|uniref:LysR family transcriptional regulator n=1 Tax=Burkholderia diffusa TaxID=488732 RepID=UPI000756FAE8|nr:LysR family transcriptional regulator [Burkholderia diffusa]KWF87038.1 LysR family transcriptional regulator [Burkholderia diffusa]